MEQLFLPGRPPPGPRPAGGRLHLGEDGVFGEVGLLGQPPGVEFLFGGGGAVGQDVHRLLDVFQPLVVLGQVVFGPGPPQPEVEGVARPVQQLAEALGTVFLDVLVGVLGVGDVQHPHLHRTGAEQLQRAQGRLLPRLVRIVAEDDLVGVFAQQLDLILGQGGAAGADGGADARLLHTDDIHIPLAEDVPPGGVLFGHLQGKDRVRFVIDQSLGAVDVLGLRVVHHPPAEGDDVAPQVKDGGDDPPPEQAVDPPRLAALEQAAGVHLGLGVALVPQKVVEGLSVVGGVAQPEAGDGPVVQPPPPPVGPGLRGLVHAGIEAGVEKPRRLLVHREDAAAQPAGAVVLLGLGHPGPGGQHLDRLGVAQGFYFLYKSNDVSTYSTAEAIKILCFRINKKRWRFFIMEGTQSSV